MKNVKLSLFVTALTLAIAIPSGVYAQGNDGKDNSKSHKIECKSVKTEARTNDYKENTSYKKDESKKHDEKMKECKQNKDMKKECKQKMDMQKDVVNKKMCVKPDCIKMCKDKKIVISAENKAALQAKKDAIKKIKVENKTIKNTIKTNTEAVKVELKRIEESKLAITPETQAKIDEVILAMKNDHKDKVDLNCPVKAIKTDVEKTEVKPTTAVAEPKVETEKTDVAKLEVNTVKTAVQPTVEVNPVNTVVKPTVEVEKTYVEKIQARLDKVIASYTTKNTELKTFSDKILKLLDTLRMIK